MSRCKGVILYSRRFVMAIPSFPDPTIPQRLGEIYRTKENKRKTPGGLRPHRSASFSALALGAFAGFGASTEKPSGWMACSISRKLLCTSRLMA